MPLVSRCPKEPKGMNCHWGVVAGRKTLCTRNDCMYEENELLESPYYSEDEHSIVKTIQSVGDYINYINNLTDIAWWRGECGDFGETRCTASILRKKNYEPLYKHFYELVFDRITANEKEHFLAFCQHCGIQTNLLDITSNPLIALWFACESGQNDGRVYGMFYSYGEIDVTGYVDSILPWEHGKYDVKSSVGLGKLFYECSRSKDDDFDRKLLCDFCKCLINNINHGDEYKKRLIQLLISKLSYRKKIDYHECVDYVSTYSQYYSYDNFDSFKFDSDCREIIDSPEPIEICAGKIFDKFKKIFSFDDKYTEFKYHALSMLYFTGNFTNKPLLIYKPLLSFSRAAKQQSAFIYQHPYSNKEHIVKNRIEQTAFDCTLIIPANKKAEILETLEKLNINRATVYNDYDNIAKWLNETKNN